MGVYVPTRFPRNCRDCSELGLADVMECYPDEYGEDSDGNKIVCPLIEIPDEIWEALKPKVDTMSMALKGWVEDVLKNKNGFGVDNGKESR